MTVNVNLFEMNSAFVEPVFMSINAMGFDEKAKEKMKGDMELMLLKAWGSSYTLKLWKICLTSC